MDEGPAFAVGGQFPGGGIFKTLDDSLGTFQLVKTIRSKNTVVFPLHTVFPEPLYPTMRVRGVLNPMVSRLTGPNERTPRMDSFSILDMLAVALSIGPVSSSSVPPSAASSEGGRAPESTRWLAKRRRTRELQGKVGGSNARSRVLQRVPKFHTGLTPPRMPKILH